MHGEAPAMHRFISGGSSKSKSKPVQLSTMTPQQQAIMDFLGERIQGEMKGPVPIYPNKLYTAKTPEEEAYFSSVYGGQANRTAAINKLLSGAPAYDINPETTEQFYQESIRKPMMYEWKNVAEPGIKEAYTGPGYWGSARAQAQTKGAEQLALTLGAKRAELAYQDELAKRAGLESAAARMPAGEAAAATEAETMGTAGQYARMIDQEKVLSDLQRWLMGETVGGVTPEQYNPFVQLAFQFLGLEPYTYGQKSESSSWNFGIASG